jgi:capsular exopolysaccharide synthesis family protein
MEQSLSLPGQSSTLSRIHETSAKFQRYKILLRRRWWFLLLTASIGVCVMALRITGKPRQYISLAKLVASARVTAQNSTLGVVEHQPDFYGTIIETLEGAEMRRRALDRVRALHPDMKESEVEIQVSQMRGSAIFNVRAFGSEPKYTKTFLDGLLDEFITFRESMRQGVSHKAINTLAEDLVRREKELKEKLDTLSNYRKSNNQASLSGDNNTAALQLAQYKNEQDRLQREIAQIDLAVNDIGAAVTTRRATSSSIGTSTQLSPNAGDTGGSIVEGGNNGAAGLSRSELSYLSTRDRITEMNASKIQLLKTLKPQHPLIQEIDEKIAKEDALLKYHEQQILEELKGRRAFVDRELKVVESKIKEKELEAADLGMKLSNLQTYEDDYNDSKRTRDELLETVRRFQTSTEINGDNVQIMERASGAVEDLQDWLLPIIVGLVVGLGAGIVILLLFDRLDDRMNSFSEFQALFPNEQILGQIPEQRQRGDVSLLRANDDRHLYAEAFRNVRSSILFKNWRGKPPKTILITSAVPNEGKTTVVSNLAITMALAGSRVLLGDCDLRRGGVNELFKLPVGPGLSEALRGKTHWRDAVQETGTRGLDLLARGEVLDQTSEMLLSKTAEEMLREMSDEYDYVIFDSAPVLVADDTASFAPKLDSVIFVVRMSSTMARLSAKSLDLLYERQVNVGGVILNRSSSNLKEYTYYNYASYYYAPVKPAPAAGNATPS